MNVVTPVGGDSVADLSWPQVLNALLDNRDQSA
jgi:anthranilate phosphoribosyltransferase